MVFTTINSVAGTSVRLVGLSSSDLNGKLGVIHSTNFKTGRHVIVLEGEVGQKVKTKPGNLEIMALPAWPLQHKRLIDLQRSFQDPRVAILRSLVAGTFDLLWRHKGATGQQAFRTLGSCHDVFSLPLDSKLRIIWRDPTAGTVSDRDKAKTGLPGPGDKGQRRVAGTLEFTHVDPASLAMEFHTMGTPLSPDDFKNNDGSLLYLMGESDHDLFGSAAIHYMARSSVAPTPPNDATVLDWDNCVPTRSMKRYADELKTMTVARRAGMRSQTMGVPLSSLATVAVMNHRESALNTLPFMSNEYSFPREGTKSLPGWWRRAVEPWDTAFSSVFEGGAELNTVPCMFFASLAAPTGSGCGAPPGHYAYNRTEKASICRLLHDEGWLNRCRAVRDRRMWLCAGCGVYAGDSPCASCSDTPPAFLCGQCPATIGRLQCAPCESAHRRLPEAVEAAALNGTQTGSVLHARYSAPQTAQQVTTNLANACGDSLPRGIIPGGEADNFSMTTRSYDQCNRCGKNEGKLLKCGRCKNVMYCSSGCQKEDWSAHKKICASLKDARKEVKKTDKPSLNMYTDATGAGNAMLLHIPSGESVLSFKMSNGGNLADMANVAEFKFTIVDELPTPMQLLLSCGFLPDLERVRRLLPVIGKAGVTELRAPGAGFSCLDWAARKGLYEVADHLCTAPESKALLNLGAPVGWACYTNRVELGKLLVRHGADPSATDQVLFWHKPPAFVAAENGSLLALKWLHEDVGQDLASMRDRSERGILAIINSSRVQNCDLTPAHVACAKYARLKGAVQ